MKLNSISLDFKEGQQRDKNQTLNTTENIQKEGKSLKVVATKEEICTTIASTKKRNVEENDHHCDEMLRKSNEEIKLLEYLMKDSENEDESEFSNEKHSQFPDSEWVSLTSVETVKNFSSQNKSEIVGLKEIIDEYEVVITGVEHKLFVGSEVGVKK